MAEQHARPRLILHAGLGKTGSSAIQKYLRENVDRLADRGVNYLGMQLERPVRSPLDFVAGEPIADALATPPETAHEVRDRLSALLQAKIAAASAAHTHIWSQVSLSGAAELMRPIIAELAADLDISVVLYFRHKADWLASAYAQWGIRHKTYPGPMRSFDEFLPLADKWGADYRRVIESWRSVAENVELRSYDAVDDVVGDFLSVTGIDPDHIPDRSRNQHYGTPDAAILTLFKLYQGQRDGTALPGDLAVLLESLGVANRRHRAVDPALSIPEAAAWDRFVATIEPEMDGLRRDFGMEFAAGQRPATQSDAFPAPATVVPVLLEMIVALSEKVDRLERQFRARAKPIAAAPRSAKSRKAT